MKRILSLVLCMAVLLSSVILTVSADSAIDADPEKLASITTENIVRYTPDKETYKPGEIIYINVSMNSIWGNPELVGHIPGYEDEMPGAYGMSVLTACVVFGCFDSTNYSNPFTPMAVTDLASSSTILNMDRATVGKSALSDAKRNGWMNWFAGSPSFTEEEDAYGMFNGSGDLCTFRLKVNEDATPGTYYIPVGPYAAIVTEKDDAIAFGDIHMNYFGVCNSFNDSVDPNFVTAVTNTDYKDPKHADNPYEGAYVKIVIEGETPTPPETSETEKPDAPMSFELKTDKDGAYSVGDTVEISLNVKDNEGISGDTVSSTLSFCNTNLKLLEVSSPISAFGEADVDYTMANKLGAIEDIGKLVEVPFYFDGSDTYSEDGAVVKLKFEVLGTAVGGATDVSLTALDEAFVGLKANVNIAGSHTHSFTTSTNQPTCTNTGSEDTECSCGLKFSTLIPANGHTESDRKVDTAATCDKAAQQIVYCANCDAIAKIYTIGDPLGHDIETIVTEVSCTQDGTTTQRCKRAGCTTFKADTVVNEEMYGHKNSDGSSAYGESYVAVKPTTNSVGYMGKKCALCGEVWMYEDIAILPVKHGDCNMDGTIGLNDAVTLLKHLADWEDIYFSIENADVNVDKRVNVVDVTTLLKYIAGWDVELGKPATQL